MQDKNGRPFLKLADAKPGMIVELDDSFTCRIAGNAMLYHTDGKTEPNGIYFFCDRGIHFISSQCDDGIHCTGIYPPEDFISKELAA